MITSTLKSQKCGRYKRSPANEHEETLLGKSKYGPGSIFRRKEDIPTGGRTGLHLLSTLTAKTYVKKHKMALGYWLTRPQNVRKARYSSVSLKRTLNLQFAYWGTIHRGERRLEEHSQCNCGCGCTCCMIPTALRRRIGAAWGKLVHKTIIYVVCEEWWMEESRVWEPLKN